MKDIIIAKNIIKDYQIGDKTKTFRAINDMSFNIVEGNLVCILGPSGAGKSTLLNLLGGMDRVTGGDLFIDGTNIAKLNNKKLTDFRRTEIGFIFQFYNLMPNLTAIENVELAVEIKKDSLSPFECLKAVGLETKINNFPSQLSGGEQQRVSIARALAKNPKIILCDEPTGALDYETGKNILSLLVDASFTYNKTVIIVTHNSALKDLGNEMIKIKNGIIEETKYNSHPKDIKEIER